MDPYRQCNRDRWNEITAIHAGSKFYDVDAFKQGQCSLKSVEVDELGDVAGKSLLHLQCHFGLDTLSWARRGAQVTGVDFAERAIAQARELARELNITARFLCADVLDLGRHLQGQFDIVFTSYGVLTWLPDLRPWAETVAHFLKPGGTLYLVEMHPFACLFDENKEQANLVVAYPYFHEAEPIREDVQGTYADRGARVEHTVSYSWQHGLGEILTALLGVGLRLQFVHEFPFLMFPMFPSMTQGEDGWWRLPEGRPLLPLLFSVKAVKDGG
jgi:2-polyprenyl-3-methyl-5-hydroxy-6-metoxy-1,4-benzoquinol methylase